jgi:hypothetical protein
MPFGIGGSGSLSNGASLFAPTGSSSSNPSWYPSVGVCVEIDSGTTIGSAVRAESGNSYGGTDPDDTVEPWSGADIVYIGGQPYLVNGGGGHGDSAFNGMMKFGPLYGSGSDTPTWTTFLAPSATGDVRNASTYLDGRQSSVHTYNNLVGVNDRLYSVRTEGYYSVGNADNLAFYFTPAGQTSIANSIRTSNYGAAVDYDGKIYTIGGNAEFDRLRIYTIATDSWASESNADIALTNYVSGAADTTRGAILMLSGSGINGGSTSGAYWDVATLTRRTSITRPSGQTYSLEYDPDRDAFVSYQSNSLTVYEADAADLASGSDATWTTRTFTGDTPAASPTNGTYGRFRYVPELKGYIVAPSLEGNVYFMRSA